MTIIAAEKEAALSIASRDSIARICDQYQDADPFAEHCVIGLFDVLRAHFLICDFFTEAGAGLFQPGPRDLALLESAVGRQQAAFFGVVKWKNEFEKVASLFYGLVKDHPFHDANKRTAFLIALYSLHLKGFTPTITAKEFEDFTVEIASGSYTKKARYKKYVKSDDKTDAAVYYIADYFKKNFRRSDKTKFIVTFRELNQILKKYGYELCNPSGNYIDLIRREQRRKFFGFGPKESIDVKILTVGFPGWSKQVISEVVDKIRKATDLTHKKGIDSAAFFGDADPAAALISRYQPALERLAYR